MTPRRALFDVLQSRDRPSWLVVRNMTGAILDSEEIPAGADLTRRFAVELLQWLDAGWQVGEFSSTAGTFFCTRGSERRMVGIQSTEPGRAYGSGASGLQGCPACED